MHLFGELPDSLPPDHSGSARLVYFLPLHLASVSSVGADLNYPFCLSLSGELLGLVQVSVRAQGQPPFAGLFKATSEERHS